jgi:hypothetical protein
VRPTCGRDFALDTTQGDALVNEFVGEGLLEPPNERSAGYGLTREFFALAVARVVEPLPRSRAKLLLTEACMLAERHQRRSGPQSARDRRVRRLWRLHEVARTGWKS